MKRTDRKTTGQEAPMVITPSMVRRLFRQIGQTIRPSTKKAKPR
jgi:hypothetical protein